MYFKQRAAVVVVGEAANRAVVPGRANQPDEARRVLGKVEEADVTLQCLFDHERVSQPSRKSHAVVRDVARRRESKGRLSRRHGQTERAQNQAQPSKPVQANSPIHPTNSTHSHSILLTYLHTTFATILHISFLILAIKMQ